MHCYPKRLRLPKRVTQFECGQRVRSGSKRVQAEAQQVYFVRALWRARGAPGLRLAGVRLQVLRVAMPSARFIVDGKSGVMGRISMFNVG